MSVIDEKIDLIYLDEEPHVVEKLEATGKYAFVFSSGYIGIGRIVKNDERFILEETVTLYETLKERESDETVEEEGKNTNIILEALKLEIKEYEALNCLESVQPDFERWPFCSRYEGHSDNFKKNGIGKIEYANGDEYIGRWLNNKKHGDGTYRYKQSGDIFTGTWENDYKHSGSYIFYSKPTTRVHNGEDLYVKEDSKLIGTWENGEIIKGKWISKSFYPSDRQVTWIGKFKENKPYGRGCIREGNHVIDAEYTRSKSENDENSVGLVIHKEVFA